MVYSFEVVRILGEEGVVVVSVPATADPVVWVFVEDTSEAVKRA